MEYAAIDIHKKESRIRVDSARGLGFEGVRAVREDAYVVENLVGETSEGTVLSS